MSRLYHWEQNRWSKASKIKTRWYEIESLNKRKVWVSTSKIQATRTKITHSNTNVRILNIIWFFFETNLIDSWTKKRILSWLCFSALNQFSDPIDQRELSLKVIVDTVKEEWMQVMVRTCQPERKKRMSKCVMSCSTFWSFSLSLFVSFSWQDSSLDNSRPLITRHLLIEDGQDAVVYSTNQFFLWIVVLIILFDSKFMNSNHQKVKWRQWNEWKIFFVMER